MSRLSAAEKQRQYRARRNADPEKRAAYLQKHRETWQENKQQGKVKAVKDLSEREKRRKRAYWRKAQPSDVKTEKCWKEESQEKGVKFIQRNPGS
ncbi:unnamed protein product [Arctogadus glacialis]